MEGGLYEWAMPILVLVLECVLFIRQARRAAAMSDVVRTDQEAIKKITDGHQVSPVPTSVLDRDLEGTVLERAWETMKVLAKFPAPALETTWRRIADELEPHVDGVRASANKALLIGLLGTVVSLAWAFHNMGNTLMQGVTSTDPASFAKAINPHLGRFFSAFIATGLGVGTAIWLAGIAGSLESLADNHCLECQAFLIDVCAPVAIPPAVEYSLMLIQKSLEDANRIAEDTAKHMRGAALMIAKQVRSMQEATAEATEAYRAISGDVKVSAERLESNVTSLRQVQDEIQRGYTELQSSMQKQYEQLYNKQDQMTERFIHTAENVQRNLVSHANIVVNGLNNSAGRFDAATDQFRQASEEFRKMSHQVGLQAYNAMESWSTKFHEELIKQVNLVRVVETRLHETAAAIRDLMNRLSPQLLHSDDWQKVRKLLDEGVATGQRYLETHASVRDQLAKQNQFLDRMETTIPAAVQATDQAVQSALSSMRELTTAVGHQRQGLDDVAAKLDRIAAQLARLDEIYRASSAASTQGEFGSGDGRKRRGRRKSSVPVAPDVGVPADDTAKRVATGEDANPPVGRTAAPSSSAEQPENSSGPDDQVAAHT